MICRVRERRVAGPVQYWVAVALAGLALVSLAADPDPKPKAKPAKPANLTDAINTVLARAPLKGIEVGVHVVRLSDGKTLFSRQSEKQFVPASNQKLLTTAAALDALGPDYEFRTTIGTAGRDLVVVGGGDPTISGRFADGDPTEYFRRWAKVLKSKQLTRFAGDLVLDDSFFDRQLVHPNWPKKDLGRWYAAPIGALALNDDCVDVRVAPGPELDKPGVITLIPATRIFSIDNRTRTVASLKDHAPRVDRRPGNSVIQCDGAVFRRAGLITSWVTVDDPTAYFGAVLREVLAEEGVTIAGTVRRSPGIARSGDFQARLVHRFRLTSALAATNKESQNFYAEQILKTMGAERGDGSWPGGRRVATESLTRIGLDPESFTLDDGCGLSRENRVSPRAITTLLVAMHRGRHGELFRESLSVAGSDGTLARRLTDESTRGRIFAKTGSITGVRAISGYAQTRSGEWLAFSFLANNVKLSIREIQDDLCKVLIDAADR